ncbi:MAG: glycosyltransferase family 2 protein [Bdellovibrionales bacterium]|nr:glycosyltransferase family 2 protein [Bdellovibrionales bacterium]
MQNSPISSSTNGNTALRLVPEELELSVVIPCLNEAETLEHCIRVAQNAIEQHEIDGEVVVADNGSTDGSIQIAQDAGARVVRVPDRGYGNALMAGIAAARGRYVIMGDADASYDFAEIPNFIEKLRGGCDLVQGCRLESGGGTVNPGAMPLLHRWIGNPFFSSLVRIMFKAPIHDVNCGLRGFSKAMYERLEQRCTGMEFAVEMVLKASLRGEKIGEVPITLHKDGRVTGSPHLRTFRDGWRTLRFFLISSPRWLFLYPGVGLILVGLIAYLFGMPNSSIGSIGFGVNTLVMANLAIICGYQVLLFSVFTKTFAITEGLLPSDQKFERLFRLFNLERGLIASGISTLVGLLLVGFAVLEWVQSGFGPLNTEHSLRLALPGMLFTALGVQSFFASFFLSILGMRRK